MYTFDPLEIQKKSEEILGLEVPVQCAEKLALYAQLLLKWNASYNLTSIKNPEDVMTLHLMDSLSLVKNFDDLAGGRKTVLDVGSGGGLPAIPLAIMRPDLSVTMVDAVQKKVIFLRQCIALCKLTNARALHTRIEKLTGAGYGVVTSRAFASLEDMVSWTKHLLAPDGIWLAMKGKFPQEEIDALPPEIVVEKSQPVNIDQGQFERHLLVLKSAEHS